MEEAASTKLNELALNEIQSRERKSRYKKSFRIYRL
jgi:hypothetical protein